MPNIFFRSLTGIFFSCIVSFSASAQRFSVSGYLKDAANGETLPGAVVVIKELGKGTAANSYGFYSISLDKGDYTLEVNYLGYKGISEKITLDKNLRKNYNLASNTVVTKEAVVVAEGARKNVEGSQMSTEKLQMEQIKTLPVIMGEVDLLKTLQLLPGVQSAGEGNSGFYVRGGGPDQNLILLDGATIYNAGHLFGFFSVFNSDAIKDVTLIKGGMPADYGGRLSSVVDVRMKEGNNQKFNATGGIGLIASRLTLEGPIQKGKSSFIVSGRRTYIDVLTKPFVPKDATFRGSGYYFYDLNAKLNYQFSDKDRVFLSGYFGEDRFTFKSSRFTASFPWGNATVSGRWNHLFSNRLFMNATALFSNYNFSFGGAQNDFDFKLFSGVKNLTAKVDFDYYPNIRHSVKFGGQYIRHIFTPNTVSGQVGDVILDPDRINKQYANETALYVLDDFDLTERLRFNIGARYSTFQMVGPYDHYIENDIHQVIDTVHYKPGQNIKFYQGIEPRASVRYQLNRQSSIKAAYSICNQYLHLASVSGSTLPTDLWIPSSGLVRPQRATQYALGYFRNFAKDVFESSVEVYYKDLNNQIDFRENDNEIQPGRNVENLFVFGKGRSYGSEFFIKKRMGKFNGWIGYTLSYTKRQFKDLNSGIEFYAKYDRRHDASVVLSYQLTPKWTFGTVFVYGSGSAFSLPSKMIILSDGTIGLAYDDDYRNKYRLKPYHRADVSITYNSKKNRRYESSWNFSVYNVYNRMNQYFVFLDIEGSVNGGNMKLQPKQVTIFPIIPSITWNFKF